MILSDATLEKLINERKLVVEPMGAESLQPASIDCRLGTHFLTIEERDTQVIHMDKEITYREVESERMVMPAHSFLLATTLEYVELPDYLTAFVEGRSSIGRMGLFIQNAGWVDPGFKGRITLELYNANSVPIEVVAGRRICQLVFCQMDAAARRPYDGKYQGQERSVGSRIFRDQDF